jgi:NIPSNAP
MLRVGAMAEAVKLYQQIGFPALQKGKHDKKLIGYFQVDTGTINQILHLRKFDDDADRRAHWAAVYATRTRRGLRVKISPTADDAGSEAASGCTVGAASLVGRTD